MVAMAVAAPTAGLPDLEGMASVPKGAAPEVAMVATEAMEAMAAVAVAWLAVVVDMARVAAAMGMAGTVVTVGTTAWEAETTGGMMPDQAITVGTEAWAEVEAATGSTAAADRMVLTSPVGAVAATADAADMGDVAGTPTMAAMAATTDGLAGGAKMAEARPVAHGAPTLAQVQATRRLGPEIGSARAAA